MARPANQPSALGRLRQILFGAPRDLRDPSVFHKISLIAFLAWVGLGADGLSSSAYGPDESFRALLEHNATYLAIFLAVATALTVFILSYAYSRVIEHFPTGGGGYAVATKLLSARAGVVSGGALLIDYVLTITVSVASGGDALFSMLPLEWHYLKQPVELLVLAFLILLNLRGVKESVTTLLPIFLVFVVTHLVLIGGGILTHVGRVETVASEVAAGVVKGSSTIGAWGLFLIFLSAYSRGSGTYTGIEAVSNGLQIMRAPQVATGKRTMAYMAGSLAFTAGGILVCYLLFAARPVEGQTMNSVLAHAFADGWRPWGLPLGPLFVLLTLASEGALLFVAAQTGFIGGPRVMANMAIDSWLPHRFASLSDRLTMKDGVLLMGGAAIVLLLATGGSVSRLVLMYAINVFITFALTQAGMCRFWISGRREHQQWPRHILVHVAGLVLSLAILLVTVVEKFTQGAWVTIVITSLLIALCGIIRRHYHAIAGRLRALDEEFAGLPSSDHHGGLPARELPTAVLMVGRFGGMGIHSILSLQRTFPGYFKNILFVSVAVVDFESFKGVHEIERLRHVTEEELRKYVALARRLGWNADLHVATGIDAALELTRLCFELARLYPRVMFFAGKLLWKRENWFQRLLHNETAYQVQRRLQWKGLPMAVLPVRLADADTRPARR